MVATIPWPFPQCEPSPMFLCSNRAPLLLRRFNEIAATHMTPLETLFFAPPGSPLISAIAGLFGLLVGSFLNVVIHRLPRM